MLMSEIVLPPSVIYIDKERSYGQPSEKSKTAVLEDEFLIGNVMTMKLQKKKMKLASIFLLSFQTKM